MTADKPAPLVISAAFADLLKRNGYSVNHYTVSRLIPNDGWRVKFGQSGPVAMTTVRN